MKCPDCQRDLIPTDYRGIRIDECPGCRGRWFDRDGLREAKDRTDDDLRWLDFDPFGDEANVYDVRSEGRQCPRCSVTMGSLTYETSGVVIDKCGRCHGIWLNHGEFEKIVEHLERIVSSETAAQYLEEAGKQAARIPAGPVAGFRDFVAVLRLLEQRLAVEHPRIANAVQTLYGLSPFR
ncbi:MAG TPA: zf-TFIIB domain-containing protein [Candidatus Methylomirabilis sp.]|nr:zf-TFIIB domain-containing protein [Candidatus Methylomirabilis sp.]